MTEDQQAEVAATAVIAATHPEETDSRIICFFEDGCDWSIYDFFWENPLYTQHGHPKSWLGKGNSL